MAWDIVWSRSVTTKTGLWARSAIARYFIVSLLVVVVFTLVGAGSSFLVFTTFGEQMGDRPPQFIQEFTEVLRREGIPPATTVRLFNEANANIFPLDFYLLDPQGKVLTEAPQPRLNPQILHPLLKQIVPGPPQTVNYRPARGDNVMVARLESGEYLVLHLVKEKYNLSQMAYLPAAFAFLGFLMIGFSLCFFYILWQLRQRFRVAQTVVEELKQGNLQSRFPVTEMDEFGRGMTLFNEMADEIEALVHRLRKEEAHTKRFFLGVAHDLRTPIASLKSLLETLGDYLHQLPPEEAAHLLRLSQLETNYFAQLVEDMLFLSGMDSGRLRREQVPVDQLLHACSDALRGPLDLELISPPDLMYSGDRLLLERMLRNVLENAVTYAASRIVVTAEANAHSLYLRVEDDGPGFSPEEAQNYGKVRHSRRMVGKKLSLGMGSVIVAEIVRLHAGELHTYNGGPRLPGAVVEICFPRSH